MKISEFGILPKEFGKRPNELHTTKQKLMHGSEINHSANVSAKAPPKKKRSFADMLKLTAGVAATAVIAVSTAAPAPEEMNYGKYHFFAECSTYKMDIEPGGYGAYLDLSTGKQQQALADYCTDWLYNLSNFIDEHAEEYIDDPDPNKVIEYVLLSKNSYDFGNLIGRILMQSISDDELYIPDISCCFRYDTGGRGSLASGGSYNDLNANSYNVIYANINLSSLFDISYMTIEDFAADYGELTRSEIQEITAQKLDELFSDEQSKNDLKTSTLTQFTVGGKGGGLIVPEFIKVVRNDDVYGYKKITLPKDSSYLLVTGTEKQPINEPWSVSLDLFPNYTQIGSNTLLSASVYGMDQNAQETSMRLNTVLSDYIVQRVLDNASKPDYSASEGTISVYYELAAVHTEETVDLVVPQITQAVQIEEDYYIYRLTDYSGTYTITNNGGQEAVVIANLELDGIFQGLIRFPNSLITLEGDNSWNFGYESLMPGESLTINVKSGFLWDTTTWLTMPKSCTVVDSAGNEYEPRDIKIDLVNGKVKVD